MRASFDDLEVTSMSEDAAGRKLVIRAIPWGDMDANFVHVEQGLDHRPGFAGLLYDNCSARHWGYVLSGRMRVVYNDHEEIMQAGDMFYLPPYHMPHIEEDTVMVVFTPQSDLAELRAAMAARDERNAAAAEREAAAASGE